MSALTDLFTSLSNKIRSKLGTTSKYTPAQAIAAIDNVYNKGVTDTQKGNATDGDVKSGKTYTSTSGVNRTGTLALSGNASTGNVLNGQTFYNNSWTKQTGTMTNNGAVSPSGLNCGGSYTIPAGYHNGSGKVTANSLASQTSANASASAILQYNTAWVNGNKITGTIPQNGSYGWAQEAGITGSGSYVRFPYGYYTTYTDEGVEVNPRIFITQAQAKNLLSHSTTKTPIGGDLNNSQMDLGEKHNYRYVNTNVCFTAGYNNGMNTGYKRNQYFGKQEWSGANTSHSFTFNNLMDGGRYFFTCMIQQTGGTYSGVGPNAYTYAEGTGVISDGNETWEQLSCQTEQTSGSGGMVMRSFGAFNLSGTTSAIIRLAPVNNITGYWCVYLWGSY